MTTILVDPPAVLTSPTGPNGGVAPVPTQPASPKAEQPVALDIITDCTALPSGYECLHRAEGDLAGFAVTLAVTAALSDEQARVIVSGAGPAAWPLGLRPWRSSIRGVTLMFFTGDKEPALIDTLHCAFGDIFEPPIAPDANEPGKARHCTVRLLPNDAGQLLADGARLRNTTVVGNKLLEKLESELHAFVTETTRNWKEKDLQNPEILRRVKRWFDPNTAQADARIVIESQEEHPDASEMWLFAAYCAEVARFYPLNTDAHVGFIVPVPKSWFPAPNPTLRVCATPWFGTGTKDTPDASELNTEQPSIPTPLDVQNMVARLKTPNLATGTSLSLAAGLKLVAPVPDDGAILKAENLLVRLKDDTGAARVDDGAWLREVEPCVHSSFLIARHVAACWERLPGADGKPDVAAMASMLRAWIALLRDMTGIAAWRVQGADAMKKFLAHADARSRHEWMIPERLDEAGMDKDDRDRALAILEKRNDPATTRDQLATWGRALAAGLRAAQQSGELIDQLPTLALKNLDAAKAAAGSLAAAMPPADLAAQMQSIADSLTMDAVLREVILADWFAMETTDEAPADAIDDPAAKEKAREVARQNTKVMQSLAGTLRLFRESNGRGELHVLARRSVAAPSWDAAVNTIAAPAQVATPRPDDIDPAPAVVKAAGRRLTPEAPAVMDENDFAEPRAPDATLHDRLLAVEGTLLREQVEQTMTPAQPSAPSGAMIAPAGNPPSPLVLRVDRLSPANSSDDAADYARRLSGFGVLVRRSKGFKETEWSCANVAVRGIEGVDVVSLIAAQGPGPSNLKDTPANIQAAAAPTGVDARVKLTRALLNGKALLDEHVAPLRLGFSGGLRQTTIAYDGDPLVANFAESLWPQDLPADLPRKEDEPAKAASPLFWLTPGRPRPRPDRMPQPERPDWAAVPALRFGNEHQFIVFGVLNAGALAPLLASRSHPCLPEMDTARVGQRIKTELDKDAQLAKDAAFARHIGTKRYERVTAIASPSLAPRSQAPGEAPNKGVFCASPVGVEVVAAGDGPLVLAEAKGVRTTDLGVLVPASDLHLEPALWTACGAPCVIELELSADRTVMLVRVTRALTDKGTFTWSVDAHLQGQPQGGSPALLTDVPPHAELALRLVRPENADAPGVEAVLTARWDPAAVIMGEAQPKPASATFVGLREQRSTDTTHARFDVIHRAPGGDERRVVRHAIPSEFTSMQCDAKLWLKSDGAAPIAPIAAIGRPSLLVADQPDARAETAFYNIPAGDAGFGFEARAPVTSLATWLRSALSPDGADQVPQQERTFVRAIDQQLRAMITRPTEHSGDAAMTLTPADPGVTHLVFELVPLFRPDTHARSGNSEVTARAAVPLNMGTLDDCGSAKLKEMITRLLPPGKELPITLFRKAVDIVAKHVKSTRSWMAVTSNTAKVQVQVNVAEGEAVQLRCYPARMDSGESEGFADVLRSSLRLLSVNETRYSVGAPATIRLDALATPETASHHVPTATELLSCLRASLESADRPESTLARDVVLSIQIPAPLIRRFAFVNAIEGRRQWWRWRGEVFPRAADGDCHPVPVLDTNRDPTATDWSDQCFGESLLRWEAVASIAQPETSYEVQPSVFPWRCRHLELLRRRIDPTAALNRLTAAVTAFVPSKHAPSNLVVAELDKDRAWSNSALAQLRANAGIARTTSELDRPPVRWKRVYAPCVRGGVLPTPKVWLVLPMSRTARKGRSVVASAMVLTIGGAFEHAGWGEDIQCRVHSVIDVVDNVDKKQWDLGSVPAHTGSAFKYSVSDEQLEKLTATVCAGPVGHTIDPAGALDPLITASSYFVDLEGIGDWLDAGAGPDRFSRPLDARVQFRRILCESGLGTAPADEADTLTPRPSEWTPPMLLRFGVDASDLAEAIGLKQASLDPAKSLLIFPETLASKLSTYMVAGHAANFQMWVLITRVVRDATTDTEHFVGIAPLADSNPDARTTAFAVATAGAIPPNGTWQARVMLVQADLQPGGQAEGLLQPSYVGNLRHLAYLLMPSISSEDLERDPWDRPESRARIMAVSDYVPLAGSL